MKTLKTILFTMLILAMLLAACQPAAEAPTTEPIEATEPAAPTNPPAVQPTNTAVVAPTAAPTTEPPQTGPATGGTVIVGTPQEPTTLNPILAASSIDDALTSLVFEGLVEIDENGNFVPVLAAALPIAEETDDGGMIVTYQLLPDVKFANGNAFTCADVQYTFDAIMSELSQASTSGYSQIVGIECPDALTVVVTYEEVYAPYLRLFSYILPTGAGDLATLDTWAFNRQPYGAGPWMVESWTAGDNIVFVKNANYHEAGKPYLDSVIVKIIPSREVGMTMIGNGEIHVLWDLTEADFVALDAMSAQGVAYAGAVTGENELLLLNFADPAVDGPADPAAAPHPILYDLAVRQALQMAIDKQLIVDTLLYGNVRVGTTVLPAGTFACPQEPSTYDLAGAIALLEGAGWVDADNDGIREKDGVRLSMTIATTSGNLLREQTEQVLVEMLRQAGIELVIENVPSDTLFASWDENGMRKHGDFDILLYTTGPGPDPDSHLFSNYHSASIPTADNEGSGSNYSRYINADVDAWLDDAYGLTDVDARRELYCNVAAQINQDLPRIYLYERLLLSGYRVELQNFLVSPGAMDFTWGSQNWWLKP